ncbi:MAG: hypothetical protein ACTSRZ_12465 [Promethearchaeota archaeon]
MYLSLPSVIKGHDIWLVQVCEQVWTIFLKTFDESLDASRGGSSVFISAMSAFSWASWFKVLFSFFLPFCRSKRQKSSISMIKKSENGTHGSIFLRISFKI